MASHPPSCAPPPPTPTQTLDVTVRDSHLTGRSEVGYVRFPLSAIPPDGCIDVWLPVQPVVSGHKQEGELLLQLTYKVCGGVGVGV